VKLAYDGLTFEVETEGPGVEVRSTRGLRVFTSGEEWAKTFGEEKKKRQDGLNAEFAEESAQRTLEKSTQEHRQECLCHGKDARTRERDCDWEF